MWVVAVVKKPRDREIFSRHFNRIRIEGAPPLFCLLAARGVFSHEVNMWTARLPIRVVEDRVRLLVDGRIQLSGCPSATVVCSPEGDPSRGKRFGDFYLCESEAVTVCCYARPQGNRFTIKEYLIAECGERIVRVETEIFRGSREQILGTDPHYQAAMDEAERILASVQVA